jgi:hypothetical protein
VGWVRVKEGDRGEEVQRKGEDGKGGRGRGEDQRVDMAE